MTATINDLSLLGVAYQDVYTAAGIVVGTPLVVQNKSTNHMWLQIATVAPSASDRDGYLLYPGKEAHVTDATEGLFAFGVGKLHVAQESA